MGSMRRVCGCVAVLIAVVALTFPCVKGVPHRKSDADFIESFQDIEFKFGKVSKKGKCRVGRGNNGTVRIPLEKLSQQNVFVVECALKTDCSTLDIHEALGNVSEENVNGDPITAHNFDDFMDTVVPFMAIRMKIKDGASFGELKKFGSVKSEKQNGFESALAIQKMAYTMRKPSLLPRRLFYDFVPVNKDGSTESLGCFRIEPQSITYEPISKK